MKKIVALSLLVICGQLFASDMKLFKSARFTGEEFVGQTKTIFGEDCSMRIENDGNQAIITVTKGRSFTKVYSYSLEGSFFYRGDYGLEFSSGDRASEKNPTLKIKLDPVAWDQSQELVPLEYKILTDSGSVHSIIGGNEKKLYKCKF